MLVSKMYRLLSVKYRLKVIKVEIWINQYLTDIADSLKNIFSVSVKYQLISV